MKTPPSDPEFARFTDAMRTIMAVPKTAIQKDIRPKKKGKRTKTSASPVPASSSTSAN